jgi:hypothetical protein
MSILSDLLGVMTGSRRAVKPNSGQTGDSAAEAAARAARQQEALEAAAAARAAGGGSSKPSAAKPSAPKPAPAAARRGAGPVLTQLPANATAPIIQVILPSGRVAGHGWQALRPEELSPLYATLDADVLARIMATAESGDLTDEEARLLTHISPSPAYERLTYYRLGGRFYTTLYVVEWGSGLFRTTDWANYLAEPHVTLSLHWWRQSLAVAEKGLRDSIAKLELAAKELATQNDAQSALIVNKRQRDRLEARLARIRRREETLYHVSAYFRVGADSLPELKAAAKRLRDTARVLNMVLGDPIAEQRRAYISSMPFASDPRYRTRSMVSDEAAQLFPFVTRSHTEYDTDGKVQGVLYGLQAYNLNPVLISPWNRDGSPTITSLLGAQGQGKSYWMRCHIGRLAMTGVQIIAIDPINDFGRWFTQNEGQIIDISPTSRWHVNPLKLTQEKYLDAQDNVQTRWEDADRKISYRLKPLFKLLLGDEYRDMADGLIGHGLRVFYDQYGTEEHLMADLVGILRELNTKNEENMGPDAVRDRQRLIDNIELKLVNGEFREYFRYKNNVELSNRKIVFNLKNAGKGLQQAFAAYLAVTMSISLASQTMERKLIMVDEIHQLFAVSEAADGIVDMLEDLVRTYRHVNAALIFATQFVSDSRVNESQRAIMKSTRIWILFKATEPMLTQAAELIGSSAEMSVLTGFLKISPEEATNKGVDRSPRRAIVYRDEAPIPIFSVGLQYEDELDDRASSVRQEDD